MTWKLTLDNRPDKRDNSAPPLYSNLPAESGMANLSGPEHYIPVKPLLDAVNTSISLGQPLLVTGEPGCGKTELAEYVAWHLGLYKKDDNGNVVIPIRFDVKSSLGYKDFLYQYDSLSHFHASRTSGDSTPPAVSRFINLKGLGEAIFKTMELAEARKILGDEYKGHTMPTRSVVLIDEIDKAPRDVPNDLLREFETMQFEIPELEGETLVRGNPALKPIVIITSNAERSLPDAFLRRCCFYHMEFPAPETLREIINARLFGFPEESKALDEILAMFARLRKKQTGLSKRPGTSELLGLIYVLEENRLIDHETGQLQGNWIDIAKVTLSKITDDKNKLAAALIEYQLEAENH